MSHITLHQVDSHHSSEYSFNPNAMNKKTNLLSLGLPLGSALVLVALLNSVFTVQSIINFMELVWITGSFSAKSHLLYLITVVILFVLTSYLWIGVIFSGRGCHLSLWIAGSLLLLLLKVVISSWTLLVFLSIKDALYWRKLWTLFLDIGMEIYIISVAVVAANAMWRRDDHERVYGSYGVPPLALPPVGMGARSLVEFYNPGDLELGTRVLVLLDIIYSFYLLVTEKIPEIILPSTITQDEDHFDYTEGSSYFGKFRLQLIFIENTTMRLGRLVLGLVTLYFLMKKDIPSKRLGHTLLVNMALVTFSMTLYFALFGLFEDLSISDRFYQVTFTCDVLLRLGIIAFLIKTVERRRLMENLELPRG